MKKIISLLILIVLILVVIFVLNSQKTDNTYSIGAIVPLSGGAANIGQPFAKGMRLAVDEINNKGGIHGKNIVLGIEDGEFSGTKSLSAAQKLASTIDPDVFDVLFALPAQALSPIFKKEGKPFLEWDYSRAVVSENEFAFKTGFDAKSGCADFVKHAKEKMLYKKLGVLMSETPYNKSCFDGIKEVESDVKEYWYNFGEDDFKTFLSKANNDGVDLLVTIPIDPEPIQIFKQISDLKLPIKMMCFTSSECIYDKVKEVASKETLRGTLASDFIPSNLFNSNFANLYKAKYPNEINNTVITWAAQGYDDVLMITEAMKSCEPKDSDCLVKSLNQIKNYKSPINSNGFDARVQQLNLRKQVYDGDSWVDL